MDLKEHLSILNHFLIIYVERVKNGSFLKPTVLRFEPRLMSYYFISRKTWIAEGSFKTSVLQYLLKNFLTLAFSQNHYLS